VTVDRRKRHLKILELISTRAVRTQEELADALSTDGWQVTQSSVSRDIAALHLAKVDGVYRRARNVAGRDPDEVRIAEGVLTAEAAGDALVVVHTPPGEANRVGIAGDSRHDCGRRHHLSCGVEPGGPATGAAPPPDDRGLARVNSGRVQA